MLAVFSIVAMLGMGWGQELAQWAPPPGEESKEIAALIDEASSRMGTAQALSQTLLDPKYMEAHPYPRFRKAVESHAPTGRLTFAGPPEPGEPLELRFQVVDREGKPVPDALVYLYQTSAKGRYAARAAHFQANSGDTKYARLFGYVRTDANGSLVATTIRPAGYPNSELPAHIHIHVDRNGRSVAVTEVVFTDDPRLTPTARHRMEQEGAIVTTPRKDGGVWKVDAVCRLRR